MKKLFIPFVILAALHTVAQPLQQRIVLNDPAKYRMLSAVHAGAGEMGFTQLIGRTELSTNFLYLHVGTIKPKSGIGHHFHHGIEEMYVLLNGEAQFTINGRTSKIKAPTVVPCKAGDSHAIYNASNESVRWLNFAVSQQKGKSDAFDLGDSRVGAGLDPIPVFVSGKLEKQQTNNTNMPPGFKPSMSRRVFGPDIFSTNWHHVDHLVIPADSSIARQLNGMEEVYYVIKGKGTVTLNNQNATVKQDESFFGLLGERPIFSNNGKEDLEILVIGIAASKQDYLTINNPLIKPKAMVLQMEFVVPKENAEAFEKMYYSIYVPAMKVQTGYLGSKLLRLFPENRSKEIQAEPTPYNYQIQISFDTEENRRKWVASKQHDIAWPAASGLATQFKWKGYDVMGDDEQR
jgi:mannose-6-phosphate isomerase-like protein (cupin superfamily)/heme-degrading monooxygenase HmoA